MVRVSEQEFYDDKDVVTQIERIKSILAKGTVKDIRTYYDTETGQTVIEFTFDDGSIRECRFMSTSVTSITGSQVGNQLTLTFHLANGQSYDVTFTVTVTATASWAGLTGQPSDSEALTARINSLAGSAVGTERTRAEGAETALGARITEAEASISAIIGVLYPVGSLYFGTTNTNPGSFLTGTVWEAFAPGRCLIGVNSDDSEYAVAGTTGGSKTVTISADQMPAHTHTANPHSHGASVSAGGNHHHTVRTGGFNVHAEGTGTAGVSSQASSDGGIHSHDITITEAAVTLQSAGGGRPVDIRAPWITVHIWKRIS